MELSRSRSPLLGSVLGIAAGVVLVALGGAHASEPEAGGAPDREPSVEATHLPPLLTAPGERIELAYDAYCIDALEDDESDDACDLAGSVFVRTGDSGAFLRLALDSVPGRDEGRYAVEVPAQVARSPRGMSYYAVFEDRATGASLTLPEAGAAAPQHSAPLGNPTVVEIGSHDFEHLRSPSARVVSAPWGDDRDEVGLEQGRNLAPIGGASFDVDAAGHVFVLDEAKRRVLRWARGEAAPTAIPLAVDGTIADLGVTAEGRFYVLETAADGGGSSLLRSFAATGALIDAAPVDRAYRVRPEQSGAAQILAQRSAQWVRSTTADGRVVPIAKQRASGRAGHASRGGMEVVVLRRDDELRTALVGPGGVARSWRVRSETPLAEVQLAEPLGDGLVVVARAYTDSQAEFVVLVLDTKGIVDMFAVPAADWAETAPLSRFRLRNSSLYQLGSTRAGLFVDRFDLEVR